MDNKFQDLHIYNWKNHGTSVMREIEIKHIIFTKSKIKIGFIKDKTIMHIILLKKYNSIKID